MQALTQQIRVGVGDYLVVLIDDEDIPFAVHACRGVVMGHHLQIGRHILITAGHKQGGSYQYGC